MAERAFTATFSGHHNTGVQVGSNSGQIYHYHVTNIYQAGALGNDQGSGGVQNVLSGPSPQMPVRLASSDGRLTPAPKGKDIEKRLRQRFSLNRLLGKGAERPSLPQSTNQLEPPRQDQSKARQVISEEVIADTSQPIAFRSQNPQTNQPFPALPVRDLRRKTKSVSCDLSSSSRKENPERILTQAIKFRNKKVYVAAEAMYRRALKSYEETLGEEHPETLNSVAWLAWVLMELCKYEEAEHLYRRAWLGRANVLGKNKSQTLRSMNNLGLVLGHQGKHEEAEDLCRRSLAGWEKVLGKAHPHTLISMNILAYVLGERGKYEDAEKMYRRAWEGREKVLGKEHPATLRSCSCMNNLARMLRERGKCEESEQTCQRASRYGTEYKSSS